MNKPTKTELKKLVAAYGKKIASQRQNAPLKTQQRFHDKYEDILNKLQQKYPESLGVLTCEFFEGLNKEAEKWISKQAFLGAGKDW